MKNLVKLRLIILDMLKPVNKGQIRLIILDILKPIISIYIYIYLPVPYAIQIFDP